MENVVGNLDEDTVKGFGFEWEHFDQSSLSEAELRSYFEAYFSVFPWARLPENAVGFDLGCGSGRWARFVAPRVGTLHCVDASAPALAVARRTLSDQPNCQFHHASVDAIPLPDNEMDFGYSLGVLHHIPNTASGLRDCVRKLKPHAPFLVYMYYALDDKPLWFRALWRTSDKIRRLVARMPPRMKLVTTTALAVTIYFPLARCAQLLSRTGISVDSFPLSSYRDASFYTMRTDALDRFGTKLEQRFSRAELKAMMEAAGLVDVTFSEQRPFWCAVGFRAA